MNNLVDVIVSLAVAAIPIIGAYALKFLKSNKNVTTLLAVLEPLAKDAVVAVEKLGVASYIEGAVKNSKAVAIVESALKTLGFTSYDESLITNAVEKQYSALIDDLNKVYPQKTLAEQTAEATATAVKLAADKKAADEKAKADALAQAQADLKTAQAKVTELSK